MKYTSEIHLRTLAPGCEPRRDESSPAVRQKEETLASPNQVKSLAPTSQVRDEGGPAASRSEHGQHKGNGVATPSDGSRLSPPETSLYRDLA